MYGWDLVVNTVTHWGTPPPYTLVHRIMHIIVIITYRQFLSQSLCPLYKIIEGYILTLCGYILMESGACSIKQVLHRSKPDLFRLTMCR